MGVVIGKDASGNIKVTFPHDPGYVARIKTVPGHKWHHEGRYWSFPFSEEIFDQIRSAFAGETIDVDPSLTTFAKHTHPDRPSIAPILKRVRDLIGLKNYPTETEEAYLHWITRYLAFHHDRDPEKMGAEEVEAFLSHLANDLKVGAGTQDAAFNALFFLYRDVLRKESPEPANAGKANKPERSPTVMSKDKVLRLIGAVPPEHQLVVKLIYGSGLRLMECLRLRVRDVDFEHDHLLIRDTKGKKDRVTVLPESLKEALHEHLAQVKLVHQNDLAQGCGRAFLPYALARKYHKASLEWAWQYVFPAKGLSRDPQTGEMGRHHLHEEVIQEAMQTAKHIVGADKYVNIHTLRHCFGVHLLEAGYDIKTVQELLGDKDVGATMIHAYAPSKQGVSVKSPLDI